MRGPRDALELAPLRGLRYADTDAGALIDSPHFNLSLALAPPYDVPDADQTLALWHSDPHNAVRVTLPYELTRRVPDPGGDAPGAPGYRRAADTLRRWIADGVLVRDPEPALYVYEQATATGDLQRGLIGALRLPGGDGSAVRPHEDVAEGPVLDRLRLMGVARANLEPIFLLYRGGTGSGRGAASLAADRTCHDRAPLVDTRTRDGTRHRLWAISDPAAHARIGADLAERTALIADGHHRYAAYLRLREREPGTGWSHGLAFLVDSDAHPPRLGAIHRVLPGVDVHAAARAARGFASVERLADDAPPPEADGTALVLVGAGRERYLLHGFDPCRLEEAMPDRSPSWRRLPTAVLHHLLLPHWGVAESSVRMVHDDPGGAVAAARAEHGTAVIVPALEVGDVYAITAQGELTPRKSTSFGPKPRTGLVMRLLD